MSKKVYYILLSILIVGWVLILFFRFTGRIPYNPLDKYLVGLAVVFLIAFRFIKERYKDIAHIVFMLTFICLYFILQILVYGYIKI